MKTYFRHSYSGAGLNKHLVVVREGEEREDFKSIVCKGEVRSEVLTLEGDSKERLWLVTEGEVELGETKISSSKPIYPNIEYPSLDGIDETEEEEDND